MSDAARPRAPQGLSRPRIHGSHHRFEVFHRTALQRRADSACIPCPHPRFDDRRALRAFRICQPQRLAEKLVERFPVRMNFGQWLRWEAAIEEIAAYYRVPDDFRRLALATFGRTVEALIAASSSLELLPWQERTAEADDEELAQRTIFSFVIRQGGGIRTLEECKALYRALAGTAVAHHSSAGALPCLLGQPVALGSGPSPSAALRISASARLVSEAWSPDRQIASQRLQRIASDVGTAVANLEKLPSQLNRPELDEMSHAK